MKLLITQLVATGVFAGLSDMQTQLNSVINSTDVTGNPTNSPSAVPSPDQRAFQGLFSLWLQTINEYGCWCYFDELHGKGKAEPVNDLDAYCKSLHEGYECILLDAETASQSCTPWTQIYNQPSTVMVGDDQILANCVLANPTDDCAARSCAVEGKFIKSVSGWAFFNDLETNNYSHAAGNFDVATECVNKVGVQSEKECCGDYPNRFPFRTMSGSRECCGSSTFDNAILQCCSDDTVGIACA